MELLPISVLKHIKETITEEKLVFFNKDKGHLLTKKLNSNKIEKIWNNRSDIYSVFYDGHNYKAKKSYNGDYVLYLIDNKWVEYDPEFLKAHIMINNKFIPYPSRSNCYHYGIYDNKNIFIKKSYSNTPSTLVDEDNNELKSIIFPYFYELKVIGVINNISICKLSYYIRGGYGWDETYESLVLTKLDKFKVIENTFGKFNFNLHISNNRIIVLDDLKLYIYRLNEDTLDLIEEKKVIIKIADYKKSFVVNNNIYFLDFANQLYSYDYIKEEPHFINITMDCNYELINIEPSINDFMDEYIEKTIVYKEEKYQKYIDSIAIAK